VENAAKAINRRGKAMIAAPTRVFLGCVAGAISVLIFHQTTLQIFFWLGLAPQAAFRVGHVPPFNMPMVLSITFWGAVYGGVFGLLMPRMRGPIWLNGLFLGLCAMLISWFVFLPLNGKPMAFAWHAWPMLRSCVAYGVWGLGVGMFLPMMHPRGIGAPRRPYVRSGLAT
jgi:hypothetical protein